MQGLQDQMKSLQEELGSELVSQLSAADQKEVDFLNTEIAQLKVDIKATVKERASLESRKQNMEDRLHSNLYKRRDELQINMEEVDMDDKIQELNSKNVELKEIVRNTDHQSDRIKDLGDQIKMRTKDLKHLQTQVEKYKAEERDKRQAIEDDAKLMEKFANKKSLLVKKKEECMKKIRDLGSLPADAFDKHQKKKIKELWKKLNEANEELKKYSHVNKKAADQFCSFSEQKEMLTKRKEELDIGHESILDLMDVLEQRKHEAILYTFKQVSTNFAEIFKKLVPNGRASLKMKKANATDTLPDEEEGSSSQGASSSSQRSSKKYDEYSGVSITISFTGKSAETLEMNQLSGGQKTLVALTLIFAIQKCDPAPFYLFDEIDQALDPVYRTAVASMIKSLSDKAQFITTTFRPELLEHAEKFYGVMFKNKVSHIMCISKDEAKDFVVDDDQEPNNQASVPEK